MTRVHAWSEPTQAAGGGDGGVAGGGVPGDPEAVEAAAALMDRSAIGLDSAGLAVGSRAGELAGSWSGRAADAAVAAVTALGRRATGGADVVAGLGPVPRDFAAELRVAQAEHTAAAAAAGVAARAVAAAALPVTDPTRGSAGQAAAFAADGAAADLAAAQEGVAAAVARAARANEAAAAAVDRLTAQLDILDAPGAAAPSLGHSDGPVGSGWTWSAWALDAVGGRPGAPEPGDGKALKNTIGGIGQGAWDLGPGAVGSVLGLTGNPADAAAGAEIDRVHDWLQHAYGADPGAPGYRAGDTATLVAGVTVPGDGELRAVEAAGEAERALEGAGRLAATERAVAREIDDLADSVTDVPAYARQPLPDLATSPQAPLYRGYDPYAGLSRKQYYERYWDRTTNNGEGNWRYPPDEGFEKGTRTPNELRPGDTIDRFGDTAGKYASPDGTPFLERAVPPSSVDYEYHLYRIVKPLPPDVAEGLTAPALGQEGGGVQYYFPKGLQYYIDHGYITKKE